MGNILKSLLKRIDNEMEDGRKGLEVIICSGEIRTLECRFGTCLYGYIEHDDGIVELYGSGSVEIIIDPRAVDIDYDEIGDVYSFGSDRHEIEIEVV